MDLCREYNKSCLIEGIFRQKVLLRTIPPSLTPALTNSASPCFKVIILLILTYKQIICLKVLDIHQHNVYSFVVTSICKLYPWMPLTGPSDRDIKIDQKKRKRKIVWWKNIVTTSLKGNKRCRLLIRNLADCMRQYHFGPNEVYYFLNTG